MLVKPLKNAFPFRLGTTSYIVPDELVPNAEFLAPLVDDVELVLFESDEISNLPDDGVLGRLKEIASESGLSYTVHLPLDTALGSRVEAERKKSVEKCLKVIGLTGCLDPFAFVMHFHGENRGPVPSGDINGWTLALERSAAEIASQMERPELLCVETLDYPFHLVAEIVFRHGFSVCLDVGHLAFYDYSIPEHFDSYIHKARVVHFHGNRGGHDHKAISALPGKVCDLVMERLFLDAPVPRVLTLEVFGTDDFMESMKIMENYRA